MIPGDTATLQEPESGMRSACLGQLQLSLRRGARRLQRGSPRFPLRNDAPGDPYISVELRPDNAPHHFAFVARPDSGLAGGLDCRRHVGCDQFGGGLTPFRKSL